MSGTTNRRFVLASRPVGAPVASDFRMEAETLRSPDAGQMLLRTVYLSLDPYMRGRMSDAPSYAPPVGVGEVMVGATVSRVEISSVPGFAVGDWVLSQSGWQEFAISDGKGVLNLGAHPAKPSYALGVLGMPGFTAYMGLLDIGQPKPGETVVVAAATGAVGSVVGQIAKLKECRVVGIAGGAEKCRYAVEELGFDTCLDHRGPKLHEELAAACRFSDCGHRSEPGCAVKAAIAAGIRLLLNRIGAGASDLQAIHLAGAFGNYVQIESANRIGLIEAPRERVESAGNTALRGAKMLLLAGKAPALPPIEHVSLAALPEFQDEFANCMTFPS